MTLLETAHLLIRDLCLSDIDRVYKCANDEMINRHLSFGSIATEKGAREYVETALLNSQIEERVSYKFAMTIKPESDIAGSCWIDISDPNSRNASVGYFVGKKHWGNGYATEMVQALLRFGFQQLKLHRIFANCDAENSASRHILARTGFHQEGLFRQHCLRSYGWSDTCW